AYAIDAYYRTDRGQRPNNDLRQRELGGRFKQQLTAQDSIFVQASYADIESGDVAQYYSQTNFFQDFRLHEKQEPNVFLGYHREWSPGQHTLLLAGRIDDTTELQGTDPGLLFVRTKQVGPLTSATITQTLVNPSGGPFSLDLKRELVAYSTELQHIWQTPLNTIIVGGRYQTADSETSGLLARTNANNRFPQDSSTDLYRLSFYAYENLQPIDSLRLTAGISYDRLHYPLDVDIPPVLKSEHT